MAPSATITVTAGPDTGRTFGLNDELVHIGRSTDNHIVLTDDALAAHQASIVRRHGRFAIYAPEAGAVHVDGSEIPPERWVWLPQQATIQLGVQTLLRLEYSTDTVSVVAAGDTTPTPVAARSRSTSSTRRTDSERARRKSRNGEHRPQVARFISNRVGEPLVRLGEDGQLPALELAELSEEQPRERRDAAGSNPVLLYAVLACSFLVSVMLLFVEPDGRRMSDSAESNKARQALTEFYGEPGQPLLPYQRLLREALIARARGDVQAERDAYRGVLRMLNASDIRDPRNPNGLTGRQTNRGRSSDDDLRQALLALLADD